MTSESHQSHTIFPIGEHSDSQQGTMTLFISIMHFLDEKPRLKDAFKELFPLATQWKSIGTLLGLSQDVLDRINSDEAIANNRLQMMTSEWLRQVTHPPTWNSLVTVVEIFDKIKAQEIRQRLATYN